MAEKNKFIYTPTGTTSAHNLRSSYQTTGPHGAPMPMPFMNFNTSLNLESKPPQPVIEGASSGQYKNLSLSMQQF